MRVLESKAVQDVSVERLTFLSTPGMRVPALIFRTGTAPHRPGVVLLHGAGARGKDQALNVSLAMLMARAGWNVIAIDLLYFGERATDLLTEFTDSEKDSRLYSQPSVYLAWMTQTVRDAGRALDVLLERTQADPERIALVGASRGGIAGLVTAGLDTRFSRVALLFAGHSRLSELDHLAPVCPANYIGRIAPRPLLMLNSDRDQSMIDDVAVQPLLALARRPKDIIRTHGSHMALTEADITQVITWLAAKLR